MDRGGRSQQGHRGGRGGRGRGTSPGGMARNQDENRGSRGRVANQGFRGGNRDNWGESGSRGSGERNRSFGGERGNRGFGEERGSRGISGERGNRGFGGESGNGGFGEERGNRGFEEERGSRGISGERGNRGFGVERGSRGFGGERGSRGFGGESGNRGFGEERGSRGFGGGRGSRGSGGHGISRGGGRGFNRPPKPIGVGGIEWSEEELPHENISSGEDGCWKILEDKKGDIRVPPRRDFGRDNEKIISVKVNHFPFDIKFAEKYYRYEVEVKRAGEQKAEPKPKCPCPSEQKAGPSKRKPKWPCPSEQKAGPSTPKPKCPCPSEQPSGDAAGVAGRLPKHISTAIHEKLILILEAEYENATKEKIWLASNKVDTLYSTRQLQNSVSMEKEVEVQLEGSGGPTDTFLATLRETEEIIDGHALQRFIFDRVGRESPEEMSTVEQLFNVVLKNLRDSSYTPVGGSSLICLTNEGHNLGGGLWNYKGFHAIAGLTGNWKPFLNIHAANHATVVDLEDKQVLHIFDELFDLEKGQIQTTDDWTNDCFRKALNLLHSCKVKYSPTGSESNIRGGTVTGVDNRPISEVYFQWKRDANDRDGRRVSVYDYFVEHYGRKDLNKMGPCLVLNNKNYVPAQLCVVKKGQSVNRNISLNDQQKRKMLEVATKEPKELVDEIEGSVQELNLKLDPVVQHFGMSFQNTTSMLNLDKTRVLAPPNICYGGEEGNRRRMRVTPDTGLWDMFKLKAKFLKMPPQEIDQWGILITCIGNKGQDLRQDNSQIRKFTNELISVGGKVGLNFGSKPIVKFANLREDQSALERNVDQLKRLFDDPKELNRCKIVLVVTPAKKCAIYTHVKQAAELQTRNGMLTQCITKQSFDLQSQRFPDSIVGNIILKMHSKLGGINYVVCQPTNARPFKIFEEPVLILGADVTHPPPGSTKDGEEPISYAAVTCSVGETGMPYMMHVQAQAKARKGAAEIVENFDKIIVQCLKKFEKMTNLKPVKIIYYRDGVAHGQFTEVLHREMRKIREGCSEFLSDYEPAITLITVQKRHKTRIFKRDEKFEYVNPPPGTVVDTDIVHPYENDFFLVSHYGALGTSRPTRYHVLWDDSDFSSDTLQQLTYYLCYMYVRCTKAVSYPAPTYYAHWAAQRAKVLAQGLPPNAPVEAINDRLRASQRLVRNYPMHFI